MFYRRAGLAGFSIAVFNGRTHRSDILAGIWRLAINGVQVFAGQYGITVCWPL